VDAATLKVNDISKSYGAVQAIQSLSFDAHAGEVIGLLGPNGAGKTTAIRVLTTIFQPSSGTFSINGIPHTQQAEIRRYIGVLPESAGYPDHQTGHEYLTYYGRLYGLSNQDARDTASALLREIGLDDRGDDLVGIYSRGMRQRLGVARALINDPILIFLDEPTLGLDPAGQRQMMGLISSLAHQRGATVILTTHLLDEAEGVCSRVIILNKGKVVAQGTIPEVKRQAGAIRTGWFDVPDDLSSEAVNRLRSAEGVSEAEAASGERGRIAVVFDTAWINQYGDGGMNGAMKALVDAQIPVLSFEREGDRLNDAFLALTEDEQR
jgi:ABC-2 type transport system ATP-binding protein